MLSDPSKKVILGLDVSTTTTGYSLVVPGEFFPVLGYVPLSKYEDLYEKAECVRKVLEKEVQKILLEQNMSCEDLSIFIEEDLQSFSRGLSSARTLRTLSRFNGIVSYICYESFGVKPVHVDVNAARRTIGCKLDKKDKKNTTKQKVMTWIRETDAMKDFVWPTKTISSGPRKGQVVILNECYDMADAYVISQAGPLIK